MIITVITESVHPANTCDVCHESFSMCFISQDFYAVCHIRLCFVLFFFYLSIFLFFFRSCELFSLVMSVFWHLWATKQTEPR